MKNQLHPLAAALSLGLLWAVCLFLWTLFAVRNGYGQVVLDAISTVYPGYEVSNKGAVIGLLWGFADGFIGTYLFASLYNFFVKRLK